MGCGQSSTISPVENQDGKPDNRNVTKNGHVVTDKATTETEKNVKNKKKKNVDSNANSNDIITNNPVPRAVAFEVTLDGPGAHSIIGKHPPKRLQRLEPLSVPKMSADLLQQRQQMADQKREKELQRKRSASKKSSRRRTELMRARQFEKSQSDAQQDKIDDQQKIADVNREAKKKDRVEKQRIRADRAERARIRAKKLRDGDADLDIDVEKDEQFNADDVDSWNIQEDNKVSRNYGDEGEDNNNDHDNDGNDDPMKQYKHPSAIDRRGCFSASTVDSYDNAFGRNHKRSPTDDFFDS